MCDITSFQHLTRFDGAKMKYFFLEWFCPLPGQFILQNSVHREFTRQLFSEISHRLVYKNSNEDKKHHLFQFLELCFIGKINLCQKHWRNKTWTWSLDSGLSKFQSLKAIMTVITFVLIKKFIIQTKYFLNHLIDSIYIQVLNQNKLKEANEFFSFPDISD